MAAEVSSDRELSRKMVAEVPQDGGPEAKWRRDVVQGQQGTRSPEIPGEDSRRTGTEGRKTKRKCDCRAKDKQVGEAIINQTDPQRGKRTQSRDIEQY